LSTDPDKAFELLIHDEANSLPPRFPLTITIRRNSLGTEEIVRTVTLDGDPAEVCSDPLNPNWCSVRVASIFPSSRVEISVTDRDGNLIAFAARGTLGGR
jgi:hypothetical protein